MSKYWENIPNKNMSVSINLVVMHGKRLEGSFCMTNSLLSEGDVLSRKVFQALKF